MGVPANSKLSRRVWGSGPPSQLPCRLVVDNDTVAESDWVPFYPLCGSSHCSEQLNNNAWGVVTSL